MQQEDETFSGWSFLSCWYNPNLTIPGVRLAAVGQYCFRRRRSPLFCALALASASTLLEVARRLGQLSVADITSIYRRVSEYYTIYISRRRDLPSLRDK